MVSEWGSRTSPSLPTSPLYFRPYPLSPCLKLEMNSLYPFSTFVALVDDRDRHLSFLDHYRGDDACAGLKCCPVLYVGRLSLYFSFSLVHIFEHFDSFCLLVFLVPVVRYGTDYYSFGVVSCSTPLYVLQSNSSHPPFYMSSPFFSSCLDNSFFRLFVFLFFFLDLVEPIRRM